MEGEKKASELMQEVKSEIFKEYKKKTFFPASYSLND